MRIDIITNSANNMAFFTHGLFYSPKHLPRLEKWCHSIGTLVDRYGQDTVTEHLGKHLETSVYHELRAQGFEIVGENTNEYNGSTWLKSGHDLDFIAEHNSGRLNIGVEVKNRLGLITKDELIIKLNMCKYLGFVPVMAVRWIEPYLETIWRVRMDV